MRFRKDIFAFAMVICAVAAFGQTAPPGLWMYTDEYGTPGYSAAEIVDTSSLSPPYTVTIGLNDEYKIGDVGYDTAATVLHYFSFDYKFTQGWSGFKLMWEDRDWSWDLTGYTDDQGTFHHQPYDSLIIKYIGPLQSHKVSIFLGEAPDRYSPAFIDSIGTIPANYFGTYKTSEWKNVSIPIPKAPASSDRTNVREVRFIIHNVSGSSLTSVQGNLSIDAVGAVWKAGTPVKSAFNAKPVVNNRLFFAPSSNALATLSVFSINGKLLVHKQIPVIAGKQYLIRQFVLSSMNMPSSQVKIARISGAGIDVCEKVK